MRHASMFRRHPVEMQQRYGTSAERQVSLALADYNDDDDNANVLYFQPPSIPRFHGDSTFQFWRFCMN